MGNDVMGGCTHDVGEVGTLDGAVGCVDGWLEKGWAQPKGGEIRNSSKSLLLLLDLSRETGGFPSLRQMVDLWGPPAPLETLSVPESVLQVQPFAKSNQRKSLMHAQPPTANCL